MKKKVSKQNSNVKSSFEDKPAEQQGQSLRKSVRNNKELSNSDIKQHVSLIDDQSSNADVSSGEKGTAMDIEPPEPNSNKEKMYELFLKEDFSEKEQTECSTKFSK